MPTPTTDEQVVRDRLDLEMLERPHLWPTVVRGQVALFLKRQRFHQTGPCFKTAEGYVVIAHHWDKDGETTAVTYNSAQAVLAAGWRVD